MNDYENLLAGYQRFRAGSYRAQRERYDDLAQAQHPKIMVVACSDSRVDPTIVFDSGPGEIFVLRNIANLVPPLDEIHGQSSVAAALEFAVNVLEIEDLVIFGHVRCGGIEASLAHTHDHDSDDGPKLEHVATWMEMISPARALVLKAAEIHPDIDRHRALEQGAVRLSLDNLMTYPFVKEAVAAGTLRLHGMIFDVADGSLKELEPGGTFTLVNYTPPSADEEGTASA